MLHHLINRPPIDGVHIDLQFSELLAFIQGIQLEDALLKRGALNGLELIDQSKGWIATNLRFNPDFKVRSRFKDKPLKSEPKTKPIDPSRLTVKQWITMLQEDQEPQKDSLMEAVSE